MVVKKWVEVPFWYDLPTNFFVNRLKKTTTFRSYTQRFRDPPVLNRDKSSLWVYPRTITGRIKDDFRTNG